MRSIHVVVLAASLAMLGTAGRATTNVGGAATSDDGSVGDQRIVCKKHVETGSLVRKVKRCFTKAEWDQISEAEQRGVKRLVEELTSRPNMGGN